MKQHRTFEGVIGAALFMAGGITVNGLADLIDRKGMDMQTQQTFEVEPQFPVSSAARVETCKACGAWIFIPADHEPSVLGYLCDQECEHELAESYGPDDYE